MADHTADHAYGARMGELMAAAGPDNIGGLVAQLTRESLDKGQAAAAALAALSGHTVSHRLTDGLLLAMGQRWREHRGRRRELVIDHFEQQPSGRVVAVCEVHHPAQRRARRAYMTAGRFADRAEFALVSD
ncbi:hypothetical protein [Nocardia wallacei]|uniref:hypothetical protein n=1 Tax=Nocardia wallacei TaxID=480035 RepID=UPI0024539D31|nr:hypothetical protein [Nocardia wallacei]